ncbi:MAG: hypothetical protein CSA29_01165 [Desulfobacterales bacterium]|nr:MAG: hypothetical protein CSA29_01165 [Desulfobacterales bacterium]
MTASNYKLANAARQELKRQTMRQDILFSDAQDALDKLLDAPSPATLIQSFPDQDLYYLMHKIGVHDFTPVLALATSKQWEYILDVEVWDDDRLNTAMMTQVFSQLFKADPQRLLRWAITQKPGFFEYYLYHNISVVIREHDEPPPSDFEDYITLDDKFYFRFPDKAEENNFDSDILPEDAEQTALQDSMLNDEAPELIETMLKTLAQMDLSVFHGLMLETPALLPAEIEEEEFRQKNIRLAEKGFLPPHEAVGIYQPVGPLNKLRKRPSAGRGDASKIDPNIPLPPVFFTQFIQGEYLFAQALHQVQAEGRVQDLESEFAALLNKIISADRIKIRNRETIQKTMDKALSFLSLGLEVLLDASEPSLEQAVDLIGKHFLEDIFRTGSREGIKLRSRAKAWYDNSFLKGKNLPLSFLGETYLGVMGGLMIPRPMFFANYADKDLYRHFKSLKDIQATNRLLSEIIALDNFLNTLAVDTGQFTLGVLTYKSMILTFWTRYQMGLDSITTPSLSPIPFEAFKEFFKGLFDGDTAISDTREQDLARWAAIACGHPDEDLPVPLQKVLYSLLREVEAEYGHVSPSQLDPRFMPLFLLTQG